MKRELIIRANELIKRVDNLTNMLHALENSSRAEFEFRFGPNQVEHFFLEEDIKTLFKAVVYNSRDVLEKELEDL